MYYNNHCQQVQILSSNQNDGTIDVMFIKQKVTMTISKIIFNNKVKNGFYKIINKAKSLNMKKSK